MHIKSARNRCIWHGCTTCAHVLFLCQLFSVLLFSFLALRRCNQELATKPYELHCRWAKLLGRASTSHSSMNSWIAGSAHNVGLPAHSIQNKDCDGYLHKMGGRHKNWKRRYCVLKDGCLFYYCDINSHSAQGRVLYWYSVILREMPWILCWIEIFIKKLVQVTGVQCIRMMNVVRLVY